MGAIAGTVSAARSKWKVEVPEAVVWGLLLLLALDYTGLTSELPFLKAARIGTMLAYGLFVVVAANGGLTVGPVSRQGRLLFMLLALAVSSILYAVVKSYVPAGVRAELDYLVLFVVTAATIDRRTRVRKLAIAATFIVLVLVARNTDVLTSGVRVGSFAAGVFMGDGNDFAWGLLTLMPLPLYLLLGRHSTLLRVLGGFGAAAVVFGVVGTQSRGATLGITAAALYYFVLLSRRKVASLVIIAVIALGAIAVSPATYVSRITETDVATDSSAQGRLRAWRAAIHMAVDYPLGVGIGSFNSAYGRFYMEAPDEVFASARWISAHSIYFKVLGESGVIGLIVLVAVLITNFLDNRRSLKAAQEQGERAAIEDRWPALLNFGLVGYAIAGAFLGGITYPHLYFLSGLTVACRHLTETATDPADRQPKRKFSPSSPLLEPRLGSLHQPVPQTGALRRAPLS